VRCDYDATPALPRKVQLTLNVALPTGTPAGTLYLASNLHGWEPDGLPLTRQGDTASATLSLEQGMAFEYKYTRGSWSTVEKEPGCAERANRKLEVNGTGVQTQSDTVKAWADLCK